MQQKISCRRLVLGTTSLFLFCLSVLWVGSSAYSSEHAGGSIVNSLGSTDSIRVLSQRANDVIYNPLDGKLYVSVPSVSGSDGNSIRRIDPMALSIEPPVWIGSEPGKLSLTANGQSLYVGLDGAFSVRAFDPVSNVAGSQFSLGFEFFAGNPSTRYAVADLAVSPTNPGSVAVARLAGGSTNLKSTAIYESGNPLPQTSGFLQDSSSIAFTPSGTTLFGSGPNFGGLRRLTVTETGISNGTTYAFCANARVKYNGGRVYCSTGEVIDASVPELLTTLPQSTSNAFVADDSVNRILYLVKDQSVPTTWILKAFDASDFSLVGTLQIANIVGDATNLVRWGPNGVAFTTSGGKIYLVQTSLIPTQQPVPTPSVTPFPTPAPSPTPIETSFRYVQLAANGSVYNPDDQKIYVATPSSAGSSGNSVGVVDPFNAALEQTIWIGSEPNKLALSSDRQKLYVGLDGSRTVREFAIPSLTPGQEYPLGIDPSNGPMAILDLAASPDSPSIIAVSRRSVPTTANHGVALYSSGIQYPQVRGQGYSLAFSNTTSRLFGSGLEVMTNTGDGVVSVSTAPFSSLNRIAFANGLVYGAAGQVIDPDNFQVPGTFTLGLSPGTQPFFAVDHGVGRAFYLMNIGGSFILRAYDINSYLPLGEISLSGVTSPTSIKRWGPNGLVITQSNGPIILVRSKLVNEAEPVPSGTLPPSPSPTPTPVPAFGRRIITPNNDIVFNPTDSRLYVSVPSTGSGSTANSITRINPMAGTIESSVPVGTDPRMLAMSSDGGTMYVSFDNPIAVRRFDIPTQTPGLQFAANTNGALIADLIVSPQSPDRVVVAARNGGTAMYVNGVMLPNRPNSDPPNPFGLASLGQVRFGTSPNLFYGFDNGSTAFFLYRITADENGLVSQTKVGNLLSGFFNDLCFAEGKLFSSDGRVVNPETNRILGTFGAQGQAITVDTQQRRAFIAARGVVNVFDIDSYLKVGRITIPVASDPKRIVRWGSNGLAIRFAADNDPAQVYILQSPAVSPGEPIPLGHGLQNSSQFVLEDMTGISVTVNRSGDLSTTSTVNYATSDGTAQANLDYAPVSGTLTFNPGESSKTISVPIFEDTIYETLETFSLTLSNPTGPNAILMEPTTTTLEIGNDDFPPGIRANEASASETRGGSSSTVLVPVILSNPSVQTVSVNFTTVNGTAVAGSDYLVTSGTVSFNPLETTKSVPVTILGDNVVEGDETFSILLTDAVNGAIVGAIASVTIHDHAREQQAPFDFDADGKTDIGIYRPSLSEWWITRSADGNVFAAQFGEASDRIVPADYTGDGKADIAIWRPSSGEWFVLRSDDMSFYSFPFGTSGDVPAPADYDADGRCDAAVFRPTTSTWFISRSTGGTTIQQFGTDGDVPVAGDYDGDGKGDIAVYRPSLGQWWLNRSTAGIIAVSFGNSSDKPIQGDYTGDGRWDVAFWRPSSGEWFILRSEDSTYYSFPFGNAGDFPAPGDYDGDGRFDATMFRSSNATWYSQRTTAGTVIQQFGTAGDRPLAGAFLP